MLLTVRLSNQNSINYDGIEEPDFLQVWLQGFRFFDDFRDAVVIAYNNRTSATVPEIRFGNDTELMKLYQHFAHFNMIAATKQTTYHFRVCCRIVSHLMSQVLNVCE